jgi:sec-independent protein translocase protein TatC
MTEQRDPFEPETKPFLDHLEDLRWAIIKVVATLTATTTLCLFYIHELLEIFYWPLRKIGQTPDQFLRVLNVGDAFTIHLTVGVSAGLILALPFALYFIGQFILPALTLRERKLITPVFAIGAFLFLGGVVFCYFLLLPQTLQFFLVYANYLGVRSEWTLESYLDFVTQMLLGFGLAFELPLVIMLLNWFGLVSRTMLREHRRHAFVFIVVAAACITPTSDLYSLLMLTVPMYLLYEVCIIASWVVEQRKRRQAEEIIDVQ